jgi:hypothetical protein
MSDDSIVVMQRDWLVEPRHTEHVVRGSTVSLRKRSGVEGDNAELLTCGHKLMHLYFAMIKIVCHLRITFRQLFLSFREQPN